MAEGTRYRSFEDSISPLSDGVTSLDSGLTQQGIMLTEVLAQQDELRRGLNDMKQMAAEILLSLTRLHQQRNLPCMLPTPLIHQPSSTTPYFVPSVAELPAEIPLDLVEEDDAWLPNDAIVAERVPEQQWNLPPNPPLVNHSQSSPPSSDPVPIENKSANPPLLPSPPSLQPIPPPPLTPHPPPTSEIMQLPPIETSPPPGSLFNSASTNTGGPPPISLVSQLHSSASSPPAESFLIPLFSELIDEIHRKQLLRLASGADKEWSPGDAIPAEPPPDLEIVSQPSSAAVTPAIILPALEGNTNPATVHLTDTIGGNSVLVLIDLGNPLGLEIEQTPHLKVVAGNGEFRPSVGFYPRVPPVFQHADFSVDSHVNLIDFTGADRVLGSQWGLSPTSLDFKSLYLNFHYPGKPIVLHGLHETQPAQSYSAQLRIEYSAKAIPHLFRLSQSSVYSVSLLGHEPPSPNLAYHLEHKQDLKDGFDQLCVGSVAYRRELSTTPRIYNIVHVSALKRYVGDPATQQVTIPPILAGARLLLVPESFLGVCKQDFPIFDLEDKVNVEAEGNVAGLLEVKLGSIPKPSRAKSSS